MMHTHVEWPIKFSHYCGLHLLNIMWGTILFIIAVLSCCWGFTERKIFDVDLSVFELLVESKVSKHRNIFQNISFYMNVSRSIPKYHEYQVTRSFGLHSYQILDKITRLTRLGLQPEIFRLGVWIFFVLMPKKFRQWRFRPLQEAYPGRVWGSIPSFFEKPILA